MTLLSYNNEIESVLLLKHLLYSILGISFLQSLLPSPRSREIKWCAKLAGCQQNKKWQVDAFSSERIRRKFHYLFKTIRSSVIDKVDPQDDVESLEEKSRFELDRAKTTF